MPMLKIESEFDDGYHLIATEKDYVVQTTYGRLVRMFCNTGTRCLDSLVWEAPPYCVWLALLHEFEDSNLTIEAVRKWVRELRETFDYRRDFL